LLCFKVFSKYTPAKPLQQQAAIALAKPAAKSSADVFFAVANELTSS